jgi:hypothetical protein
VLLAADLDLRLVDGDPFTSPTVGLEGLFQAMDSLSDRLG